MRDTVLALSLMGRFAIILARAWKHGFRYVYPVERSERIVIVPCTTGAEKLLPSLSATLGPEEWGFHKLGQPSRVVRRGEWTPALSYPFPWRGLLPRKHNIDYVVGEQAKPAMAWLDRQHTA